MADKGLEQPHVGLFVTCIVDAIRPEIGFSAIRLLERAGCRVSVPTAQTCCGQPAFNNGDRADSVAIAQQVIATFEPFDHVVVPSGSCGSMIAKHYPELFEGDPAWLARSQALTAKTFELLSYLHDVRGFVPDASYRGAVTYHHSCSGLREFGVKDQAEALVDAVDGLERRPLPAYEACCGFGGTFCVKYPEISTAIVDDKIANIETTGADTLLGGDLGCLMHIAGRLRRQNKRVRVFHTAEVLDGRAKVSIAGEPD